MRLEAEFWSALKEIADDEKMSISVVLSRVKADQRKNRNFASALRVWLMQYYRRKSRGSGKRR